MSLCPTEDLEQIKLASWLDMMGICYCHVPNGGMRSKITGARFKKMGVKAGVPDILIFDPAPLQYSRGVAIELKRRDKNLSKTSDAQRDWIERLRHCGWEVKVCYGAKAAIDYLLDLGFKKIERKK